MAFNGTERFEKQEIVDYLESIGMTFGPDLADGRRLLVIVSDNNFSAGQFTQFIALAVDIRPVQ